jgi:hypothetical protein
MSSSVIPYESIVALSFSNQAWIVAGSCDFFRSRSIALRFRILKEAFEPVAADSRRRKSFIGMPFF